jgi:hypothetical protein
MFNVGPEGAKLHFDDIWPGGFDLETYYDLLQAPKSAGEFIEKIQIPMRHWLATLNAGMPTNPKVRLREKGKRRIAVTPLDKQPVSPNTAALKREIGCRWADVDLIDIIKEVDLRLQFSAKKSPETVS